MSADPFFDAMTAEPPPPTPTPAKGGAAPADDPFAEAMMAPPSADPTAPPPPRPAGPPRLRGQALTPPPPPKPAGAPPGAPAAPPDDLSLPAVWEGAKKNLLPSAWENLKQTVEPFLPQNWGQDWEGAKALARGVGSKTGLLIPANAAQKAQDEAPLNAALDMYGRRYDFTHPGAPGGILQTLKYNPAAPLSDAAAAASLLGGGEGIAAKAPGAVENALLAAASRTSGATSGALLNAAVTGGQVARGVNRVVSPIADWGRFADPSYAATRGLGTAATLASKVAGSKLGRKAIGDVVGGTIGSAIPIPVVGSLAGMKLGEHVANRVIPHGGFGPRARAVGRAIAAPLPAVSAFSGMQPDDDGGGPAPDVSPGGAPGHGPEAAAPAAAAAPFTGDPIARFRQTYPEQSSGMSDDDVTAFLASDIGQGLFPATPSAAPAPSSGLQGAPPSATPMRAPRGAMFGHIADVATNAGANPTQVGLLQRFAGIESSGNPGATSPSGRYHGLFQYQDSQGPEADTVRALGDLRNNEQRLSKMGVTPDAGALYVMHQQGAAGGPALLTAPAGTPAIDAIARFYGSRAVARQAIAHNLGINYRTPQGEAQANAAAESMTAADFVNLWRRKLGGAPAMAAAGGRISRAEGGNVVDMSEALLRRAAAHHKGLQQASKPLLNLDDSTVAKALAVAQRAI